MNGVKFSKTFPIQLHIQIKSKLQEYSMIQILSYFKLIVKQNTQLRLTDVHEKNELVKLQRMAILNMQNAFLQIERLLVQEDNYT